MLYCRDSTEEHLEIWKKTSGKKENQEESIETAEHNKNRHFRNEKGAGTRQDQDRYWGCTGQLLANFLPVP